MNIGQKIRKLRKDAGISQEELAFRLDVSRQTVTRWERGQMIPDTERVAALAKYFGVTADELMNDSKGLCDRHNGAVSESEERISDVSSGGVKEKKRGTSKAAVVIGIILIISGILGIICSVVLFTGNGDVTVIYGTASISAVELAAVFGAIAAVGAILTIVYFVRRAHRKKE